MVGMTNPITTIVAALTASTTTHRSTDDLRADLGKIDLAALDEKVAETERERRQLLLTGTDEQLRTNQQQLDDARLQVERGATLVDELHRLIGEAERRERAAEIEAQAEGAARAKSALDKIYGEIDDLANLLKEKLAATAKYTTILAKWNRVVDKSGAPALAFSTSILR
jgi:hypothetical protein